MYVLIGVDGFGVMMFESEHEQSPVCEVESKLTVPSQNDGEDGSNKSCAQPHVHPPIN